MAPVAAMAPSWWAVLLGQGAVVASHLATGRYFSLLLDEGQVKTAGINKYGQLGIGNGASTPEQMEFTSVILEENTTVTQVAAGAFHSAFVTGTASVWMSGRDHYGQLGLNESRSSAFEPREVTYNQPVIAAAAGYAHTLFLMEDKTVLAAGLNRAGQLGIDSTVDQNSPQRVMIEEEVLAVAAGYDFSYFLTESGLWACGQNIGGQLGDGSRINRLKPVKVADGPITSMAAGDSHGLYHKGDTVFATGANFDGQLGIGATPLLVDRWTSNGATGALNVIAGGDSSAYTDNEGSLMVWGSNRRGQLGLGAATSVTVPTKRNQGDFQYLGASISDQHGLYLVRTGTVLACGSNVFGQFGDNTTTPSNVPVEVGVIQELVDNPPPPLTTPAPPAPTPAPTPVTTRKPQSGPTPSPPTPGLGQYALWFWAGGIGLGAGAIGLGIFYQRRAVGGQNDGEANPAGDTEMQENKLIMMRANDNMYDDAEAAA